MYISYHVHDLRGQTTNMSWFGCEFPDKKQMTLAIAVLDSGRNYSGGWGKGLRIDLLKQIQHPCASSSRERNNYYTSGTVIVVASNSHQSLRLVRSRTIPSRNKQLCFVGLLPSMRQVGRPMTSAVWLTAFATILALSGCGGRLLIPMLSAPLDIPASLVIGCG